MAKSPIFCVVAAVSLVVLSLMASATPVRGTSGGNMGAKPVTTSLEDVTAFNLKKEPVEQSYASEVSQLELEAKATCFQSTSTLLAILMPCSGAATNPRLKPSAACCAGTKAVTDACFCYLETLFAGQNFGFTVDDAFRVARYCGRRIVKC